jgi:HAD superfamily hydrolase (TIGR01509 family)
MIEMEINNLFFDLGGVIVLRKEVNFLKLDNYFSLEKGTTKKIVDICFKKKMLEKNFDEKSFFDSNFSNLLSWTDYQMILEKIYKKEVLNEDLLEWTKEKKKQCKIFLLTNNTGSIKKLLNKRFKINYLFDSVFSSSEIGLSKPDPKIFKYVLSKTNSSAKNCLFVDDDLENIKSAKNLGFSTILFKGNKDFFRKASKLI